MIENNTVKKPALQCEMCCNNPSKYTCPCCSIKTCCLDCVNEHKKATGCTGKRNHSSFLSVSQMSDNTLQSDYFFLKEIERLAGESYHATCRQNTKTRKANLIGKGNKGRKNRNNKNKTKDEEKDDEKEEEKPIHTPLPMALRKLVSAANERSVTLRLMARGMERRKSNTTFYAYRSKKFFWRVEWIMNEHLSKDKQTLFFSERIEDSTILLDPLSNIINAITATSNFGDSPFTISQRKKLRKKCENYISIPVNELNVLLPVLNTPAGYNKYYLLNLNASLAKNFENKTNIEYE